MCHVGSSARVIEGVNVCRDLMSCPGQLTCYALSQTAGHTAQLSSQWMMC